MTSPDEGVDKKRQVMYTSWGDMIKHWPKTTFCIVSNEFCERFSYYGMRTVLILYLLNVLKFTDHSATVFFNLFDMFCYTMPIFGSVLADGYIGKFWTIFSVSILYACGQIVLAISSTKNSSSSIHPGLDFTGLFIIALGTGGIKPCVNSFGADQFDPAQEKMISIFFSMFYFSINAGSMISTFITPIFRSMPCMGQDSCYPLAFGIPACLMIVATGVFMAGSFWYKKRAPKENIFGEIARLMGHAVSNKVNSKESKEHWLDHYMSDHDCERDSRCTSKVCHKTGLVDDVKQLLRVIIMFLPVPMFWALYNQQSSIWLIQAIQMDCRLSDSLLILPDQMQVLNAVLILVFIPIFQVIVYPLLECCIKMTPLRKMVGGGLLAALAFVFSGFVQLGINPSLPSLPNNGQAYVSVWNQLYSSTNCNITVSLGDDVRTLIYNQTMTDDKKQHTSTFHASYDGKANKDTTWPVTLTLGYRGTDCPNNLPPTFNMTVKNKEIYFVGIGYNGVYYTKAKPDKPTEGTGEFSIGIAAALDTNYDFNLALCRVYKPGDKNYNDTLPCNPKRPSDFYWWETNYNNNNNAYQSFEYENPFSDKKKDQKANFWKKDRFQDDRIDYPMFFGGNRNGSVFTMYDFKPVKPGKWHLYYLLNKPKDATQKTYSADQTNVSDANYEFEYHEQGGVYVLNMAGAQTKPAGTLAPLQTWQLVASNKVNIMWQVPQIVTITAAEILFSITGYEFAYSQSAPSMKAVVQALWLFTTALGDAIIILITAINPFSNAATQFFAFGGAMAVVIGIFTLMSVYYYDYRYYLKDDGSVDDDNSSSGEDTRSVRPLTRSFVGEVKKIDQEIEDQTDIRL